MFLLTLMVLSMQGLEQVGDRVVVYGRVEEVLPGDDPHQLTVTQLVDVSGEFVLERFGSEPFEKGWITDGSIGTLPAPTMAIYAGEENLTHGGVNVANLTGIDSAAVSEAWDEPLDMNQVLGIAGLFLPS